MRRRDLIKTIAISAVICPLAARAQRPAMPVIGFLNTSSPDAYRLRAFHQGLKEAGFVEGENVAVEYRWAENQMDRLQTLAAELVRRQVTVIVAGGGFRSGLAAKTETKSIPILFIVGEDPVKLGLVTSLAKPDRNLTGVNILAAEVVAKRLELLRELLPKAIHIGVLVDPVNSTSAESTLRGLETATRTIGMQIQVFNASTIREVDAAFAALVNERLDALFVGISPFLLERRVQLAQLAARHAIPSIYQEREHVEVGGLMSYGASIGDAYRHLGVYAGRILKGDKPADLPVMQSSKFELVINHSTARMLGLTLPPKLLSIADDVIE
ncbi:MAG TPA: ABC transporter substrate-binding protein [Pseudolabrys sp.]|nr:ABC transporter substrate-binding protein [Pseudolabrys sp.]